MKTISVKEAAEAWKITERRVVMLCSRGRIPGAKKLGKGWRIPGDAEKPSDLRVKNKTDQKLSTALPRPMPIGISDYRLASTQYYYVDKTMMIKDFLDERPMVSLFTRPRRFGKTLNMDMLRTFFEKTEEDTSVYFKDKKIWSCGEVYRNYQGKYPVIFVTFKDVKRNTWNETYDHIYKILMNEFERHRELLDSDRCSEYEKAYFKRFVTGQADSTDLITAFQNLSQMLDEHYGTAPIIIIDEYDTPIHQGYMNGFYEDVVLFMRNLFSGGLKDNKHLSFGFLTGILRVAKESIFSGLNNLKINSVLDMKYSEYFGFTPEEVKEIANHYGAIDRYEEICTWYDGYRFGNSEIFNPWSVISYFSNQCQPRPFWQATGSNEIIGEILTQADEEITEQLRKLLQGESILIYVDTDVIYPQIKSNPSSIYSFLLVAGYLKVMETQFTDSGDFLCEVALPNREITIVYNKEILQKLDRYIPQSTAISIQKALYTQDLKKLQLLLQTLLQQSVSYYDTYGENFYHGLVLGLCVMMDNRYWIHSNGESGEGRYDIQLMPRLKRDPGILIELKASRKASKGELKALAEKALNQVDEKKYDTEMKKQGVTSIFKYGVAFSGKNVEVAMNSFSTDHS